MDSKFISCLTSNIFLRKWKREREREREKETWGGVIEDRVYGYPWKKNQQHDNISMEERERERERENSKSPRKMLSFMNFTVF